MNAMQNWQNRFKRGELKMGVFPLNDRNMELFLQDRIEKLGCSLSLQISTNSSFEHLTHFITPYRAPSASISRFFFLI